MSGPFWILLGCLFLICLASRLIGYWASGLFRISPKVHRFLEVLPGPLLSSLVAVAAVSSGGLAGTAAVATAIAVMVATRNELGSALAGAAAGWLATFAPTMM